MEKRLPLALFLSFLVLFVWTLLNPPVPEPVDATEAARGTRTPAGGGPTVGAVGGATAPDEIAPPAGPQADVFDTEERSLSLDWGRPGEPGHYRAEFSNRGARLVELRLGSYYTTVGLDEAERQDPANWLPLVAPVEMAEGTTASLLLRALPSSRAEVPQDLAEVLWRMEPLEGAERGVRFTYGPGTGVVLTKEVVAIPGTYDLLVRIGIENRAAAGSGRRDFVLRPAGCVPAELGDSFYREPRAVAIGWDGEDQRYAIDWEDAPVSEREPLEVPAPLVLAGGYNKYFAFLLREADRDQKTLAGASYTPVQPLELDLREGRKFEYIAADVVLALRLPPAGETSVTEYVVYAGPKERDTFVGDHEAHALLLEEDLSTFASIGRGLLAVMGFFHGLTGNWGVAIILLTICVRAALFPLNRRSQTSMARYQKKMKRVQPRIDEVKKRFASDPQKLREAQAKIMQEEGAFPPLGGCLPIFLQLPIFFGLFSALRTSFDLRQAPFAGWIDDLSRPDRLLQLDLEIPLLVTTFDLRYLNLLPLLMVVLWIWQQAGMPKPADEQAARMQKMMMFMPILFCVLLYNYAAGLSLYMITGSALGIVEQKVIKKVWPIDDTEPVKKERKGCGPFSGMMQHVAERQREQMKKIEEMKRAQATQRSHQKRGKKRGKRR